MNATNKVAINTILHYVQLLANIFLGLFTVRIILGTLGSIDYGIYSLMGGIIVLLSFISNSLSQTSVRFISVSIGTRNATNIRQTFRSCFSLHLYIGGILFFILELIGLFLFDGVLNIPVERIKAAEMVYHSMTLTLFLNVLVTPFLALIVAHEQFIVSCGIGILDSILKLLIALVVSISNFDKLILYAVLMAVVVVFNVLFYMAYCLVSYPNLLSFSLQKLSSLKSVTGFAGWTLLDVLGTIINRQGYAVMLNKFFGPSVNTVYALAGQVEGHLYTVSSSVINTMKPQIMKSYGAGDKQRMFRLSMTAGKFGFSMMALLAVPLLVAMPDILRLWLKDVPEQTHIFARLMVLACMFEQLTRGLVYANQAVGNIKWFSIIVSLVRIIALPISIIALILGCKEYVPIVIFALCETLGSISRIFVMHKIAGLDILQFMHLVISHILPPFLLSFLMCYICYIFFNGLFGVILCSIVSMLVYSTMFYYTGLSKVEKQSVDNLVSDIIKRARL